jgi:predicted cupin superfamily sugar epimerase
MKLWTGKARVETFLVGPDVLKGERLQWIVEGGKYKASFLLDDADGRQSEGCLISETVVPGFEYTDHDFMRMERAEALLTQEQLEEMMWMVRKE